MEVKENNEEFVEKITRILKENTGIFYSGKCYFLKTDIFALRFALITVFSGSLFIQNARVSLRYGVR